tara:strand:- start:6036 stop:6335 length:300 start_codon:yes stop_codon:yes gene_type:complete
MTHKKITLEKTFHDDLCDCEGELTAMVSLKLEAQIDGMQTLIVETAYIGSVDFLDETTVAALQDQCRYDVNYISVYEGDFVLCIQSKRGGRIQAEHTEI